MKIKENYWFFLKKKHLVFFKNMYALEKYLRPTFLRTPTCGILPFVGIPFKNHVVLISIIWSYQIKALKVMHSSVQFDCKLGFVSVWTRTIQSIGLNLNYALAQSGQYGGKLILALCVCVYVWGVSNTFFYGGRVTYNIFSFCFMGVRHFKTFFWESAISFTGLYCLLP